MKELNLEVGKSYETRAGAKRTVLKIDSRKQFGVVVTDKVTGNKTELTNQGRYWNTEDIHPYDLVAEWTEPAPAPAPDPLEPLRKLQKMFRIFADKNGKLAEKYNGTNETIGDSNMVASDVYWGKNSAYEHCADEIELYFSRLEKSAT